MIWLLLLLVRRRLELDGSVDAYLRQLCRSQQNRLQPTAIARCGEGLVQVPTECTNGVSTGYFILISTKSMNEMDRIHLQPSVDHLVEKPVELAASDTGDHFADERKKLLNVHRFSFIRL
ncbi:hypothetical protein ALQ91_200237 [Pseudomonas syringae pv. syringae]|nr:hypothetical protein ALQ91_200237 [Pseudomonas syringae pv. syringae]